MSAQPKPPRDRSAIGWMIRHGVAPNILMCACLIGGFMMARRIKQEVFPDFELDIVRVTVPYPGASPEEVERGIILAVEESIRGTDGVKEVTATAREGVAVIEAEIFEGVNRQKVYQEIQQNVNRITTLPDDAEEPEVVLAARWRQVLNVEVYGDVSEWALREVVEQVRDRLLLHPAITQVALQGVRAYEVHIEVPQEHLRAYGLTLDQIAARVAATAIELPGGKVETRGGEVLLRMTERREWAKEFADIPIITTSDGTVLYLRDIARVREGFQDTNSLATFNGVRAMGITVYRVGEQTPMGVAEAVREVLAEVRPDLPPGVQCDIRDDFSDMYRQRLDLLLRNAGLGLTLVMILLAVFLEVRLAFWVTMGIPISFLGGFLIFPALGVTINMISLFAFILALGIVVDDAIVVGENIYEHRQRGMGAIEASVRATRGVAVPVAYSILTNIAAFLPLLALPGFMGKVWRVIPLVVCTVFVVSWFEAMFILPAHLAHAKPGGRTVLGQTVHHWQQAFSRGFMRAVNRYYGPLLRAAVRWRYLTVAIGIAILAGVAGYVLSGRIGMILMPRVEADYAFATATLPFGSPLSQAAAVRDRLEGAARAVAADNGADRLLVGVFAAINENVVELRAYLTPPDLRPITTSRFTNLWRERIGELTGIESLRFQADRGGPSSGASLTVELSHRDIPVLDAASARLAGILGGFANVKDIDRGYTPGKQQLNFTLTPEGHSLGLTVREVARQVRNAFYGAEALRQQRGRSEIKVRVRLPEAQRSSEADIEELMVRTPAGRFVPLRHVASVERGRAYTDIKRREGRRTVTVTADVVPIGDTNQVIATLNRDVLPQLVLDFPGLAYGYEGHQADMAESMERLFALLIIVLLAIFIMLALPFRSYIQPLIIMTSIPFGLVGAVMGHLIMGYDLSVISLMGILALTGVVVNDAIVLIAYANELRGEGMGAFEAITQAGIRRFRPIMLTTLTTFGGLAPMIFETSRQARFLIPMALSLGYGILFATGITLLLVPSLYLITEDTKAAARALSFRRRRPAPAAPESLPASGE